MRKRINFDDTFSVDDESLELQLTFETLAPNCVEFMVKKGGMIGEYVHLNRAQLVDLIEELEVIKENMN